MTVGCLKLSEALPKRYTARGNVVAQAFAVTSNEGSSVQKGKGVLARHAHVCTCTHSNIHLRMNALLIDKLGPSSRSLLLDLQTRV